MALRLAIFLGVVIAAVFAYWQFQVHQALEANSEAETMADQCADLEETNELVESEDESAESVNQAALAARLADCEDEGLADAPDDADTDAAPDAPEE